FDGALTISGEESIVPQSVNAAITTPLGNVQNVTSALKVKRLAVKIHLNAGETVVEYYCGTDSGATGGKALDFVVKDASGTVVATEDNAEASALKPYVIYYTAETEGDYTIVDSGSTSNRTLVYAVATTTGTYTPPAADATPAAATVDPDATPAPTPSPKPTVDANGVADITITSSVGWLETAYVTWTNPTPVDYYNVYVKPEGGEYTKIDDELIRYYGSYYRADALGLKAGNYQMKVEPVIGGAAQEAKETGVLEVKAQVREGFAFDPSSPNYNPDGIGGYKNDGTVKDGAKIVYITDANKDTVQFSVDVKGTPTACTGLYEILAAREKNGAETTPLIIRMIGQVESPAGKNSSGYMQIKATSNVTFEGVGDDATTYHWSFLLRDTNNVEVRNLAVMEFYDDGISLDTDNFNDWVHNCDIFYGQNRGGDQKKGDGSLDVKTGSDYCTFSYNHFWDSGKSSLCGMTADSYKGYHITYHHNWFDHSDSRHPRVRGDQVHVYNNYYDGNSKYGIGACTGSSVYVEKNVFRNCLHPVLISRQGTDALGEGTFSGEDGGVIKMYDNAVYGGIEIIYASETNTDDFDAYLAATRDEQVPS
ncbi:MAG: polysaccharide lyase family 1 protein, partial [Candidatus Ornithomonoglobus sp.]